MTEDFKKREPDFWIASENVVDPLSLRIFRDKSEMEKSRGGWGDEIAVYLDLEKGSSLLSSSLSGPFGKEILLSLPFVKEEDLLVAAEQLYILTGKLEGF